MFYFRPSVAAAFNSKAGGDWLKRSASSFKLTPQRCRFVHMQWKSVDIESHPTESRELKDPHSGEGGVYKQALVDSWCGQHIGTISDLPRVTKHVSSCHGYDVIGTFNTRQSPPEELVPREERMTSIYVPGKPPKWHSPRLPFGIPENLRRLRSPTSLKFGHGDVVEKYLWKLPMMAIQVKTPDFPFPRVDVMITAKRLERFWKYCGGTSVQAIGTNATVINNTLFLDALEPVGLEGGSELEAMDAYATCGTSWPPGDFDSFLHHRVLYYKFGPLNVVVVGSVDCLVDGDAAKVQVFDTMRPKVPLRVWRGFHKSWFHRCPVLITACKENGLVKDESIEDVRKHWVPWEKFEKNQLHLQRMVSVFQELRDMLQRKASGRTCIVRLGQERGKRPRGEPKKQIERLHTLEVWEATHGRYPLPPELAKHFEPLPAPETAGVIADSSTEQPDENAFILTDTPSKKRADATGLYPFQGSDTDQPLQTTLGYTLL
ncbi:hypothetical protein VM1G_11634 [Cytospora mali]|uniref:Uncharacterized protein n=1 Tax=Cytospora mali TaxID=578113 RepID=A0A194W1M9_CYTMA|nr:hypothetical protein VM1G_11634 [Valsa mali]